MKVTDMDTSAVGQGPAPLALSLSDRAGDETPDPRSGPTTTPGALWGAVRSLDAMEATVAEADREAATDVDAEGSPIPTAIEGSAVTTAGASRREQILDGASAMFAERGYHGASLREISRSAGISHPGMLHHFASKPALLDAVIDRLEAHAQGLLDSTEQLSTSPAMLEASLAGPWHPGRAPMTLIATLSAEIVDPEHPGRYRMARLRLVHEHVLSQVFAAYGERGLLIEGAEPRLLARTVVSLLLSLAVREKSVRSLRRSDDGDPVEDVRAVVQHFLNG